jgi:pimeloyl-ACP methyl ester carboxylesterase
MNLPERYRLGDMTQITAGYAPVDGLNMYYEVRGEGKPLVLLHGGVLTIGLSFGAMLPALSAGRQVIAMELQGHGHTADIDRDITTENLASDVVGVLAHLGVDRADVFGFSLGGGAALQLALDHPDRVDHLIAASVPFSADGILPEIMDPSQFSISTRLPTADDFQQMREAYLQVAPYPDHFDAFLAKTSASAATAKGWTPEQLGTVEAKTLLVFGDHDFFSLEHAVEMRGHIPGAQLAVLPGTTHMDVLRRTDLLVPLVTGFLAS